MTIECLASRRLAWLLCFVAAWGACLIAAAPQASWAQEDKDKPAAEEKQEEAAPEKKADEPKKPESYFMYVVRASGIFGFVILLLSIYMVAKVSRLFYECRLPIAVPPEVVGRCEDLLGQRDFKSIFEVVNKDDSFFSRCLSTGISELPNGLAEARDVVERVGESETVEWEKKINMLAVLGTVGPLVGLLGTLHGMIVAFDINGRTDQQVKTSEVAMNISTAMWTTLEGVVLAVPAIYFFALFRDRVSVIAMTATQEADRFLRHFARAARGKGAAAPGAPATAAASATAAGGAAAAKPAPRSE